MHKCRLQDFRASIPTESFERQLEKEREKKKEAQKTYHTAGIPLVVTDPTTDPALTGLSRESGRDPEFSSGYGRMC